MNTLAPTSSRSGPPANAREFAPSHASAPHAATPPASARSAVSILLVEDNQSDARLLRELLRESDAGRTEDAGAGGFDELDDNAQPREHFSVRHVERLHEAEAILRAAVADADAVPNVVLLDLSLPDGQGLDAVRRLHEAAPDVPIVILTGRDDETLALRAAQAGAQDYLVKGQGDGKLLARAVRYAIERAQTTSALRDSEERFRLLAENVSDFVCLHDLVGRYIYTSPSVQGMLGYAPEELLGRDPYELVHPDNLAAVREAHQTVLSGREALPVIYRLCRSDGRYVWLETLSRPIFEDGAVSGMQTSSRDVTERVSYELQIREQMRELAQARADLEAKQRELIEANARLHDLAATDGLTGLTNHRTFQERLREEWARARRNGSPLSLLLLDVDFFKKYNDTFGHPAGDEVLREVARLLRATTRDTDVVARYGGEEFVALLPGTDALGALRWAERFRAAGAEVAWVNRKITLSVGAATADSCNGEDETMPDAASLVSRADRALYESKARGRNRATHAAGLRL